MLTDEQEERLARRTAADARAPMGAKASPDSVSLGRESYYAHGEIPRI